MSAREAAIQAVKDHPSTTFMAPYESLADAVLTAAAPLVRAEVLREAEARLRQRAAELSADAEEEMRRDLEELAQEWHEAADVVRRMVKESGKETRA